LSAAGAGEAALAVTEELALHQLGRDRAAVDRHEGPGRARAQAVDVARDDLLAGARFAVDEHRRLVARELFGLGAQLHEGGRMADEARCRRVRRRHARPRA
jgi:hypothetical protein